MGLFSWGAVGSVVGSAVGGVAFSAMFVTASPGACPAGSRGLFLFRLAACLNPAICIRLSVSGSLDSASYPLWICGFRWRRPLLQGHHAPVQLPEFQVGHGPFLPVAALAGELHIAPVIRSAQLPGYHMFYLDLMVAVTVPAVVAGTVPLPVVPSRMMALEAFSGLQEGSCSP